MPIHRHLRETGSEVASRARQDLRAAGRRASEAGDDLASRARQDLRAAGREVDRETVSTAARRAGSSVASAAGSMGDPATGGSRDSRSRDVYRRAQEAAEMGPPVQATLEPVRDYDSIGSFATGAGGFAGPAESRPPAADQAPGGGIDDLLFMDGPADSDPDAGGGMDVGFFGAPFGGSDDDEDGRDAGGPLEFDDSMLFGGGDNR